MFDWYLSKESISLSSSSSYWLLASLSTSVLISSVSESKKESDGGGRSHRVQFQRLVVEEGCFTPVFCEKKTLRTENNENCGGEE